MSTDTLDKSGAAQAASIFTKPVVTMREARAALRPAPRARPRTVSSVVLVGAIARAVCVAKPKLAMLVEAELVESLELYESVGAESDCAATRETLEWFRDVQAWATLRREF